MKAADIPKNETHRIEALNRYELLDTPEEEGYDDIAQLASYICQTPIALVSIVDSDRQWFKAKVGLNATETHRDLAFCSHAILQNDVFIVKDASQDPRFHDSPLVTSGPNIRFYAGAPLVTPDGFSLGTICVIDKEPRQLTKAQTEALSALSRQTSALLELRRTSKVLTEQNQSKTRFLSILSHDLSNAFNGILFFSKKIQSDSTEEKITNMADQLVNVSTNTYDQLTGLLEWARNEITNVHFMPKTLPIEESIKTIIESLSINANQKSINIDTLGITQKVFADKNMLASVIRNLLSNAIKFSPKASVIQISCHNSATESIIAITDHGPGLPEKKIDIFKGVSNFDSTKGTEGESGNGLGLNLVYQIMKRHKGSINAVNTATGGVQISLHFPKEN